jgi:hypothetical protein
MSSLFQLKLAPLELEKRLNEIQMNLITSGCSVILSVYILMRIVLYYLNDMYIIILMKWKNQFITVD